MQFEREQFEPISVSRFLDRLNDLLKSEPARVVGEVCQIQHAASGHVYFVLKDKDGGALINCALWRSRAAMFGAVLKDGVEVILTGNANIYAPSGRLSFIAEAVELVGEGALKAQYEALKKKLTDEGLFAPERKKELPLYPHRIGVITSTTGAVIHDFGNNLGKHGFAVQIMDARVEGAAAVPDLLAAVNTFKKHPLDVLVIIRGGGSFESLAAFDNEALVRAICDLPFPVIAGIGHHQDQPLLCYAADLAVSTPTAAAVALNQSWQQAQHTLAQATATIVGSLDAAIANARFTLQRAIDLTASTVQTVIMEQRTLVAELTRTIFHGLDRAITAAKQKINLTEQIVKANDPARQLRLGYSLVRHNGKILTSVATVQPGDPLTITLADGTLDTTLNTIHHL